MKSIRVACLVALALAIAFVAGGNGRRTSSDAFVAGQLRSGAARNATTRGAQTSSSGRATAVVTAPAVTPHLSPPARTFPAARPHAPRAFGPEPREAAANRQFEPAGRQVSDGALVPASRRVVAPPQVAFEGLASTQGTGNTPPDTVGDVGPNHYVQMTNRVWNVWNKAGQPLRSPMRENTPWRGAPRRDPCRAHDQGDPVVVYDQYANRWVFSYFAFATTYGGDLLAPFYECIAVSKTSDPLGAWCAYTFKLDKVARGGFPDYPKFGVWPDGYYMTANVFGPQNKTADLGAVFERSRMLGCRTARVRGWLIPGLIGMLPSDADGPTPPPAGSPNYMILPTPRTSALRLYKFSANWGGREPTRAPRPTVIHVAPFQPRLCSDELCVPQPGTPIRLHALDARLMNRLVYRNFGDHEALVLNHEVNAAAPAGTQAGIRWYEIRNPRAGPLLYQQGTYAPDADFRWVGSAAFDKVGDIAVAYSVSGPATYPSLRYTARGPGDPLGSLDAGEATLAAGGGSVISGYQGTDETRWGDYASLNVDPVDDCLFWFTGEYLAGSGDVFHWNTRIGAFKVPGCA